MPEFMKLLKSHLFWPAGVLIIICIVTTAALSATSAVTRDPIARQAELAESEAQRAALPEGTSFEAFDLQALKTSDPTAYGQAAGSDTLEFQSASRGSDASGAPVGIVVKVSTQGYGQDLILMIGLTAEGTVSGLKVLSDNETPGLGKKVAGAPFVSNFLGKPYESGFALKQKVKGDEVPVDAVTGATVSSRAVIEAVNAVTRLAALLEKGGA